MPRKTASQSETSRSRPPARADTLIVATKKFVACLNTADGVEIWRTALPEISSGVISVLVRGDDIFAGTQGRVFCLDRRTGQILWQNDLPKMGYQHVILALEGTSTSAGVIASIEEAAAQAAAAGGAVVATSG